MLGDVFAGVGVSLMVIMDTLGIITATVTVMVADTMPSYIYVYGHACHGGLGYSYDYGLTTSRLQ